MTSFGLGAERSPKQDVECTLFNPTFDVTVIVLFQVCAQISVQPLPARVVCHSTSMHPLHLLFGHRLRLTKDDGDIADPWRDLMYEQVRGRVCPNCQAINKTVVVAHVARQQKVTKTWTPLNVSLQHRAELCDLHDWCGSTRRRRPWKSFQHQPIYIASDAGNQGHAHNCAAQTIGADHLRASCGTPKTSRSSDKPADAHLMCQWHTTSATATLCGVGLHALCIRGRATVRTDSEHQYLES